MLAAYPGGMHTEVGQQQCRATRLPCCHALSTERPSKVQRGLRKCNLIILLATAGQVEKLLRRILVQESLERQAQPRNGCLRSCYNEGRRFQLQAAGLQAPATCTAVLSQRKHSLDLSLAQGKRLSEVLLISFVTTTSGLCFVPGHSSAASQSEYCWS